MNGATITTAADLRDQATQMARWSRRLDELRLNHVHLRAGAGTWRGPMARACEYDLGLVRAQLVRAADLLTEWSRELHRRADALDAVGT